MPATQVARNKRNCDDRVRAIVRARGYCERCGTTRGPFEHAHIIRRNRSWTRTDERNGWCLCHECHQTVDGDLMEHNDLVERTIGWDLYRELQLKARTGEKFDWKAELERLKALVKS